jgi:hypothetical protein
VNSKSFDALSDGVHIRSTVQLFAGDQQASTLNFSEGAEKPLFSAASCVLNVSPIDRLELDYKEIECRYRVQERAL